MPNWASFREINTAPANLSLVVNNMTAIDVFFPSVNSRKYQFITQTSVLVWSKHYYCHQSSVKEDSVGPQLLWAPSAGEQAEIAAHQQSDHPVSLNERLLFRKAPARLHWLTSPCWVSLSFLSGPLDHSLWRAVEEDEFGVHVLLQVELARLSDQEDVCAQLEDAVHVWQLLEHDGVRNAAEKLTHELADDQNHRGVQAHDPTQDREMGN